MRTARATKAAAGRLRGAALYCTFDGELVRELYAAIEAETGLTWPNPRYADDPVGFARDILGIQLIHDVVSLDTGEVVRVNYQAELLDAVRDHNRVAVTSGHKLGKSLAVVVLALWWYCSFPDARVIMTSSTSAQVNTILWRELRMVLSRAGRCVACKAADPTGRDIPAPCPHSALIPEEPGELAHTGLKSKDFREIWGFSAKQKENAAGISGGMILYIADEASGIGDPIFEAIEGNLAAGAKIVMLSNPTRNSGWLYDAFHKKSKFWKTFRWSSEMTINYITGERLLPGLAERGWVEDRREEHGENSAWFLVRVKGKHATAEDGRPFDHATIAEAQVRDADAVGRLCIGIDPSGGGKSADDTAFAVRRSKSLLRISVMPPSQGASREVEVHLRAIAVETLRLIGEFREAGETERPLVVYDAEGPIGYKLGPILRDVVGDEAQVYAVRASDGAKRMPRVYERWSAELVRNAELWLKGGGQIPHDEQLEDDLYHWAYYSRVDGKVYVDKKQVIKALGRSPDRGDAFMLSLWEPTEHAVAKPRHQQNRGRTAAAAVLPALRPDFGGRGKRGGGVGPWG